MFMPAATDNWTVEMLDALPDDGQRYEIIDGRLFVTPSQAVPHQEVVGELYHRLRLYFSNQQAGKPMVSPSDVWRGERARNRVQPDVYVVRRVEGGVRAETPFHLRDLLLAVEVVSHSSALVDYHVKRELYLSESVPEYWIIDPSARVLHRWSSNDEPGETIHQTLRWKPAGMSEKFVLELPAFFDEAFR